MQTRFIGQSKIRILLFFLFIAFTLPTACNNRNSKIKISLYQMQVPVLKLKKENPILRIKIDLPEKSSNIRFTSVTATLTGTDDLQDIQGVRMFYLGTDSLFPQNSPIQLFGKEKNPEKELVFRGNQKLQPGPNFLWLSVELSEHADLHHKVDAGCKEIRFADGTKIQPPVQSPSRRQRIGVAVRQHLQDNVDTYRIPGLATTNDGTLLAIYDVRRNSSRDLQGDIDIGISRSTDGGNTWEPMRLALDMDEWGDLPQKYNGVSDACILVDKNSDNIFIAGLWMHGVLDKNGHWIEGLTESSTAWEHQWRRKGSQPGFGVKQTAQFLLTKSSDDGKTWSKPVNLTRMCKKESWWLWAPAPGHGITLKDGTLLFPTQGRDGQGTPFSNITYSKDGGKTWRTSRLASIKTTECQAVQLSDGRIMLNIRDNRNRTDSSDHNGRSIFTTNDLGQTWTEHSTSRGALIESTCMASLHKHIYHQNGEEKSVLLFSNPNTKKGRHHTTIKVSFDDGMTWPEKYWLLLDEGKNRGYSCLTSIDEHTIGILYEGSQADMTFESIPLEELLMK